MRLLLFLFAMTLAAAEPPRIAVIGGPQPLWPEVLRELQRRYPALSAHWEYGIPSGGHEVDRWFADYPTHEEASGADLSRTKQRRLYNALPAALSRTRGQKRVESFGLPASGAAAP